LNDFVLSTSVTPQNHFISQSQLEKKQCKFDYSFRYSLTMYLVLGLSFLYLSLQFAMQFLIWWFESNLVQ